MTTSLYKKGMVLAIICLFIGASVLPSITGKIDSYKDINEIGNINSDCDIKIFYPTDDTFIDHSMPDVPKGLMPSLRLRNDCGAGGKPEWAFDVLTKFDISILSPGTCIISAKLKLYYHEWIDNNPARDDLKLYRINSSWDEVNVTWNTQPSHNLTPIDIVQAPGSPGIWTTWNVTSDVRDFVNESETNYGWILRDEIYWGSGNIPVMHFRSKEYGDKIPKLEIEIDDTPPVCEIISPRENFIYTPWLPPIPFICTIIIGEFLVEVEAWDAESGTDRVEMWVGDELKGFGKYNLFTRHYDWLWDETRLEQCTLKAVAWNTCGNNASDEMDLWYFNIYGSP